MQATTPASVNHVPAWLVVASALRSLLIRFSTPVSAPRLTRGGLLRIRYGSLGTSPPRSARAKRQRRFRLNSPEPFGDAPALGQDSKRRLRRLIEAGIRRVGHLVGSFCRDEDLERR